jgi:hypothetical protein
MFKNPSIIAATIGVVGTLLGVTLGYFLNLFKSSGKLKIYINSVTITYSERDNQGGMVSKEKKTSNSERATVLLDLDIYNSASEYRIMREIMLRIESNDHKKTVILRDESTRRAGSYMIKIDDLKVITIAPKAIINLNLSGTNKDDLDNLDNSKIFLKYLDFRQKEQSEKIKNCG